MKAKNSIDYTKMELGKVTRTFRGRATGVITRCAKCDRRGERSLFLPETTAARGGARPNISWYHSAHVAGLSAFRYMSIDDHCTVLIDKTNVDELLNVAERKDYDAYVAALRAWVEAY